MANEGAFSLGLQSASDALAARRQRKQALSDQAFQETAERLSSELAGNRDQLRMIDKTKDPSGYANKIADMERNLGDLRRLYHPDHRPDGFARFGHILLDKLKISDPQKRVASEAARRAGALDEDERQAMDLATATPNVSADQFRQAQIAQQIRGSDLDWTLDWAKRHGVDAEGVRELTQRLAGVPASKSHMLPIGKPFKGPDGSYRQTMRDSQTGQLTEEVMPEGYTPPPSSGTAPIRGWTMNKSGQVVSVLLDRNTNQPVPGSENENVLPPSYLLPHISSGQYHFVDADGNIHEIGQTRTSGPALGPTPQGSTPAAAAPRSKAGTPAAGTGRGDRVIGFKGNATLTRARNTLADATRTAALADTLVKDAAKAHQEGRSVAEQDGLFVLSLIRSEAGRVNQKEIDQLFKAGGLEMGPTRWAARVGHGELPDELRRQLQTWAHEKADAAKSAVDALQPPAPAAKMTPGALRKEAQDRMNTGISDEDFLKTVK